jgi:signal peptidase II
MNSETIGVEFPKKRRINQKVAPLSLTALIIALDQITKALVIKYIPRLTPIDNSGIIEVFGKYVRLIHVRNKAVAFSLGSSLPDNIRGILFSILPLIVIILVFIVYFRNNDFTHLQRWSICGIIGGGLGNLIDRFFRPDGVVDFIDCYFFNIFGMERWPTFNIADSAVVICGALFIISFIIQLVHSAKSSKDKGQDKPNE